MADCYVRIHPPLRLIVVPMRDNALPIGHNPVLFDVLRDLFGE